MKILFITHTRIGDAVISSGLLHHLVQSYPDARFTVVCGPLAASLFAAVPGLDRVIPLKKQPLDLHWYRLWKELRGTVWDIAIDLRRSLITYFIPVRRRYVVGPIQSGVHHVTHLTHLLSLTQTATPFLFSSNAHSADAAAIIPDGAPVLALAPVAATALKTWPAERFAELARRLTAPDAPCAGWRVALFGAPDDAPHAQPIRDAIGETIDVFNQADLLTVHAALARCRAFVGNDSGLSHLAAAAGVPALALFGPSDPARYRPWSGAVVQAPEGDLACLSAEQVAAHFPTLAYAPP